MEVVNKVDVVGSEVAAAGSMDFGDGGYSSQDVIIPKVLVMQGLSNLVMEGKAKFGDLVDNQTQTVIGNVDDAPIEFIPFHLEKIWIVSKKNGNKYEFSHIDPVTIGNENRQWEEVRDGAEWKNEKSFNFYSILPSDPTIPYIIQFKGTSQRTGKELATQMYVKNKASGLMPPSKTMTLKGSKISNDKGTYIVLKTEIARDTAVDELGTCLEWYKAVHTGKATASPEA